MTEKEFLIKKALDQYNSQFGHNIQVADCNIKSLAARVNYDLSYEVWTRRLDDYLRLRMHVLFDRKDSLSRYRLETDGTSGVGILTDEVFVGTGYIDSYWKESGIFKFPFIYPDDADETAILLEDGTTALLLEDASAVLLETAV